jgi:hypothetical protein
VEALAVIEEAVSIHHQLVTAFKDRHRDDCSPYSTS